MRFSLRTKIYKVRGERRALCASEDGWEGGRGGGRGSKVLTADVDQNLLDFF